nr:mesoderm posterior protein 1-like [Anolis sagrei ordinatus]
MRRLARALRELRRFLPPSVAPPARPLTKLQTLRLATRYIAHLGALLRQEGEAGTGRDPPGGGERQAGAEGARGAWGSWEPPSRNCSSGSEAGSPPETQWPWETPALEEEALPAAPQSLLPPELLAFLEELEPWPAGNDHYPLA